MKYYVLVLMLFFTYSSSVSAMSHGKQGASRASLLPVCQEPNSLPSPHCGLVPTTAFGKGSNGNDDVLNAVFSQNGHIYFTTSTDNGQTFERPTVVNRIPEAIYDDGENRPKIVVGNKGEIFVSWTHKTAGRYSGDVRFSRSLDGGKHFDTPITINSNRALISHRFDAMSMDSQGRLYLIWIDKRDLIEAKKQNQDYRGAALYYVVSEDAGANFSSNRKLVDNSCECCRIAVDQDHQGNIVALWRHVFPGNIRDHAISYLSPDEKPANSSLLKATNDDWMIEGCPHHGPDLSIDSKNTAHMAWFTKGEKHKGLIYGQYDFETQSTQFETVIDASAGASRPQVQVMGDTVYLMWKQFDGKAMTLNVKRSRDGGKTWKESESIASTLNGSDHPDWITSQSTLYAVWHTQSEGLRLFEVRQ